jgi:glycine C-acetyltransferase
MKRDKTSWIDNNLEDLKKQGLFIKIRTIDSPMDAIITVDGKTVINFCSNNYLGMANNKRIRDKVNKAIDKYGIGPTAVRTIAGTMKLHRVLERTLAKFKKAEDVIVLQSGFTANLATIPALFGKDDLIFSDELNHASIIDACRLSKAKVIRYKHKSVKDLKEKISQNQKRSNKKLIVTDGVFSMDGDITPLDELYKIGEKYGAFLMVDDAHGEGVLGKNGRGIVDHFKLHGKIDLEVGTLSKAFGVVGGYVAGKKVIIDWLRQRARPFLFSSAMTIPDTAASLAAVEILQKSDKPVKKLWENTKYFKSKMANLGFDIGESVTPIVPVMLGDAKLSQSFSQQLFDEGVFATAIGYPTVPKGKARIRVMNSAAHSKTNLDKGLAAFEKIGKSLKII